MKKTETNELVQIQLYRYRLLCDMVSSLEMQRETILTMATKITPNLSPEPGGGGDNNRKVESWAIKLAEIDEKIDEQINAFAEAADEVMTLISLMPESPSKAVVYDRYIVGMNFDKIAREHNYSISHIYLLHRKGLETLSEIMSGI